MNEKKITAFIYFERKNIEGVFVQQLLDSELVDKIYFLSRTPEKTKNNALEYILIDHILSSSTINEIKNRTQTDYALFVFDKSEIKLNYLSLNRLIKIGDVNSAGMVYSDFLLEENGIMKSNSLIDYQPGSIRDDFDFGSMILVSRNALQNYSNDLDELKYSGFYSLVLSASRNSIIKRIPEELYLRKKAVENNSIEKHFNYIDSSQREIQFEREKVVTDHLKKIGAFISPPTNKIDLNEAEFPVEASIIIPVKNRETTIADAIKSALGQKTNFRFNVIVVDNHSADRTSAIIKSFSEKDPRIVHIIPESKTLKIGGCWNLAINNTNCGRFSVQLDSDDLYFDDQTLQKIIVMFHEEKSAMVIGSYRLVDFAFEELPPGIIDHNEWTDENGCNNALRINGLGAPRAYYTPLIRQIQFPNVSYGEDYAVVLEIIRAYKISRIYEPIYLCRRWMDNTDFQLNREKENKNNWYKDYIRTNEIKERKNLKMF